MHMDLIDLVRRAFHLTAKDTVSLTDHGIKASIIATTVDYDGTSAVRAPAVSSTSWRAEEVSNVLCRGDDAVAKKIGQTLL